MTKKQTRLRKSTEILSNAIETKWCHVDIDNKFEFLGLSFVIDESVEEYKVHNKAFAVEDYTNESYMDEILAVVNSDTTLSFYNQNYDEVEDVYATVGE
ncbi:hypothetical protein AB3N02_22310 [Priestia aryabhattai]